MSRRQNRRPIFHFMQFDGRFYSKPTLRAEGGIVHFTAKGQGRAYKLEGPQSFWRSFASINPGTIEAVRAFVVAHGDPFEQLASSGYGYTADWQALADLLKPVADLWEGGGVIRRALPVGELQRLSAFIVPGLLGGFEIRPTPDGGIAHAFKPRSLSTFMAASALYDVDAGAFHTRCKRCDEWMWGRPDSIFCGARCRSAYNLENPGSARRNYHRQPNADAVYDLLPKRRVQA